MKMLRSLVVLAFFFASSPCTAADKPAAADPLTSYISSVVRTLSDDSMKGRAAGTKENLTAAFFIAHEFAKAGLQPIAPYRAAMYDGSNGTAYHDSLRKYFQKFSVVRSRIAADRTVFATQTEITGGTLGRRYNMPADYFVQAKGQTGTSATARVVFCGYGIEAGPGDYSDFRTKSGTEVDLHGAAVLAFEGYPGLADSTGPFSKKRSGAFLNPLRKAETAQKRGAVALLIVEPRKNGTPSFEQRYDGYERMITNDAHMLPGKTDASIPVIFISRKVARELMTTTDDGLDSIAGAIDRTLKSEPAVLASKTVSFEVHYTTERLITQNVVGILPGTDPVLRNEYIVMGAHYDHVGLGSFGSSKKFAGRIHNGADDNASGTAGLLRTVKELRGADRKRSIVFIAFSAEEMGLLGSYFYVNEQPIVPLKSTIAMLNLDMIGRNEKELLWLAGAFYSSDMKDIAERANGTTGFTLLYNTGLLNFASDQGPFLRKKIPALFFFSGLHDDYHTPADKADLLDIDKIARVSAFASSVARELLVTPKLPEFRELSMPERTILVQESLKRQNGVRPKSKQHTIDQQIQTEE